MVLAGLLKTNLLNDVVTSRSLDNKSLNELRGSIYVRAVDIYNLPWDFPIEIRIMTREEFNEAFTKRGKKVVNVMPQTGLRGDIYPEPECVDLE